jgi:hypothetical protein
MMADEFGVNRETIRLILVEDLGKRKVVFRFVPHSLSDDQRHERVQYAKDIIKTARRNKKSSACLGILVLIKLRDDMSQCVFLNVSVDTRM